MSNFHIIQIKTSKNAINYIIFQNNAWDLSFQIFFQAIILLLTHTNISSSFPLLPLAAATDPTCKSAEEYSTTRSDISTCNTRCNRSRSLQPATNPVLPIPCNNSNKKHLTRGEYLLIICCSLLQHWKVNTSLCVDNVINQAESLLLFKGCFVEIYIQRHLTFVQNLCNKLNLTSRKISKNTF